MISNQNINKIDSKMDHCIHGDIVRQRKLHSLSDSFFNSTFCYLAVNIVVKILGLTDKFSDFFNFKTRKDSPNN